MPLNCQSVNDALFLLRGIKCGYSQTSRDETHLSDFLISSGCLFVATWHMAARVVSQACWPYWEGARPCRPLRIFHQSSVMEEDGLREVQSGPHGLRASISTESWLFKTGRQSVTVRQKASKFFVQSSSESSKIVSFLFFCPAIRRRAIKTELVYNNDE